MNRITTWMLAAILTICGSLNICAQEAYFTEDDLPNGVIFLPEPPDTTSTKFVYDITQYMWGKSMRDDTDRLNQAVDHVVTSPSGMALLFSVPFGMTISEENTPAIYNLLNKAIPTIRLSATYPKATYMRKRPYVRFNEPTGYPATEEELRNTGSYPSGHTVRGWGMALLLCEINPAAQNEILKLGFEWGQSRVILGYHWQSDVDASRLLAAACVACLHTNADFLADMKAAREEFAQLSGQGLSVSSPTPNKEKGSAVIYDLQGRQINNPQEGIYIIDGEKVIRR